MSKKIKVDQIVIYILLIMIGSVIVVPFLWLVSTAFKKPPDLVTLIPQIIPRDPTLANFAKVLKRGFYLRSFLNSLIIAATVTFTSTFLSAMVGYGLSRYGSVAANFVFVMLLTTIMIPTFALIIPWFLMIVALDLSDNLLGVMLPFFVSTFGVFLMRQHCQGIPQDYIDSARIDGASEPRIFFGISLHLVKSGLMAVAILKFLGTWNDFLWPLIVLTSPQKQTIQLSVISYASMDYATYYGLLMAASTLALIPIVIAFVVFQRWIIPSVAMSGLKS